MSSITHPRLIKAIQLAKRTLYYVDARLGILASGLPIHSKPDLPAYAATSPYMVIFFNEERLMKRAEKYDDSNLALLVAFIIFHEYGHHMLRFWKRMALNGYDPRILNIAQDLVINTLAESALGGNLPEMLDEMQITTIRTFQFPPGLSTDAYYKMLLQNPPPPSGGSGEGDDDGAGETGQCCSPDNGEGDPTGEGKTKLEMDRALADGQEVLDRISNKAKARGYTPDGFAIDLKLVDVRNRISWEDQLRDLYGFTLNSIRGSNHTNWAQYSRRQAGLGFGLGHPIMPAHKDYSPNIAVVLDTSGSMSDWIAKAATHVYTLVEHTKSVRFLSCDAAVHSIEDIRNADDLLGAIKGGGGTDMRPAFDVLRDSTDLTPDVVVCVTDGEIGDPGPTPTWEHIWVCNNTAFRPPWGKVIYVEHEGN